MFAATKEDCLLVHTVNECLFRAAMSWADLPEKVFCGGERCVIAQQALVAAVLQLRGFWGTCILHIQVRKRPHTHTATKVRPVILITGWGLQMDLMTGEF